MQLLPPSVVSALGALLLATSLGVPLLTACDSDAYFPEPQQQLVIEGWIDDGGFPIVIPTLSLPVATEEHSFTEIKDNILRWALVSITDGTDTVILRGHYNEGYFPPYIYTDNDFRGQAGHTYTINVDYREFHATATTTIPPVVTPDSICLTPVGSTTGNTDYDDEGKAHETGDAAYEVVAHFIDPPNQKDYYALFSRCGTNDLHFRLSSLGTLNDADFNVDSHIKARIFRAPFFRKKYQRYFLPGDTVGVKFAHVDERSYYALTDYAQAAIFATNAFIPAHFNIRSNIEGGLGYWVGCGAAFAYFIVPGERRE